MIKKAYTGGLITIRGDLKAISNLKTIKSRAIKSALRSAITASIGPMVKLARRLAPTESKLLKKAIDRKIVTYARGNVAAIVGANKDNSGTYKGKKRVPSRYLHLVENPTRIHAQPKRGKVHPGTKGTQFLRRAFDLTRSQAQAIAERKLKEVIEREAVKLAAKGVR